MSKSIQYETAAEFIDAQPERAKAALLKYKECIMKVAPNAEELLNYNIAAYALIPGGKREAQIMLGANKSSIGFYPHPSTMIQFETELEGYIKGKGSVQFSLNNSIPKDLIVRMVKYRLELLTR
ncbi:MAG: hypothetical protein ACJA1A_003215 [Saprospiraceae bacterium]|jgi:uncharacterized protein YdhG (YjbR/CyaY superfamily)|tara:strand:+ start:542 stop:913 length:372 start_codon:yes stop_codon:yes gene_type:complete